MASINLGTVYTSLELRTERLERGATDAEARLKRMERNITGTMNNVRRSILRSTEDIGRSLSLGITAPLLALGTAAVKSATQLDSLKRGLVAIEGSTQAADRALARLKEVAKLPGLSFREAVQGYSNLRSVGINANLAERSLKAFGNALATVGKGRAELEGINLALSQIIGKGKVSADEINQLAERLPQIRRVMMDAFGTADTEVLQKMGLTSEKFIEQIVASLEKLPRATAGAQTQFENMGDAIQAALSAVGDAILPFVNQVLNRAIPALERFSEWFQKLDKGTKDSIVTFSLWAVGLSGGLFVIASFTAKIIELTVAMNALAVSFAALAASPGGWLFRFLGGLARIGANPVFLTLAALVGSASPANASTRSGGNVFQQEQFLAEKEAHLRKQIDEAGIYERQKYIRQLVGVQAAQARLKPEIATEFMKELERVGTRLTTEAMSPFERVGLVQRQHALLRDMTARGIQPPPGTTTASVGKIKPTSDAAFQARQEYLRDIRKERQAQIEAAERDLYERVENKTLTLEQAKRFYDARLEAIDDEFDKKAAEGAKRAMEEAQRKSKERAEAMFAAGKFGGQIGASITPFFQIGKKSSKITEGLAQAGQLGGGLMSDVIANFRRKRLEENRRFDADEMEQWKRHRDMTAEMQKDITRPDALKGFRVPDMPAEVGAQIFEGMEAAMKEALEGMKQVFDESSAAFRGVKEALRNSLGGMFAQELGYGIGEEISRGLARFFGDNVFGRALSRAFSRWIDNQIGAGLDSLFNFLAGGGGLFGKSSGILAGDMPIPGKPRIGGALGGILGGLFGGPVGGAIGGLFGGLLGFDNATNDATARRYGFDFAKHFQRGTLDSIRTGTAGMSASRAAGGGGGSLTVVFNNPVIREGVDIDSIAERVRQVNTDFAYKRLRTVPGSG